MDHNEGITEKLIQYLDGELSADERKAVEQLLSSDEAVQREFQNLELAREAVRTYGLKNQVATVRKQMLESEPEGISKPGAYPFARQAMKYAAVLFFALISVTIYMYSTTSAAKLYEDSYQPYRISVARGESSSDIILNTFKTANYPEVIADFKKTANHTNRDYFLTAQSYQLTHQYQDAIREYNELINLQKSDNSYVDDAEYYLGLTYLENQQVAKAKTIFEKIHSSPDHLYYDKVGFWMMLRLKMLAIKEPGK